MSSSAQAGQDVELSSRFRGLDVGDPTPQPNDTSSVSSSSSRSSHISFEIERAKHEQDLQDLLDYLRPATGYKPKFLYRASFELCIEAVQPTALQADLYAKNHYVLQSFKEIQSCLSVYQLIKLACRHLQKIKFSKLLRNDKDYYKNDSRFISSSSNLRWTLHATGQRALSRGNRDLAGLAIFSTHKIWQAEQTSGLTFQVKRLFEYMQEKKIKLTVPDYIKRWAMRCDEYLSFGCLPWTALERFIPWTKFYEIPSKVYTRNFECNRKLSYVEKKDREDKEDFYWIRRSELNRRLQMLADVLEGDVALLKGEFYAILKAQPKWRPYITEDITVQEIGFRKKRILGKTSRIQA